MRLIKRRAKTFPPVLHRNITGLTEVYEIRHFLSDDPRLNNKLVVVFLTFNWVNITG